MNDTIKATVLDATLPQPEPGVYYIPAYSFVNQQGWFFMSASKSHRGAEDELMKLDHEIYRTRIIRVELPV